MKHECVLDAVKRYIPKPVFRALRPAYHFILAWTAAVWHGFPSRRLTVIGVTGTNGKTTVAHLLHDLFSAAGFRVGSLSSLRFRIGDEERPNLLKMTMPGRFALQRFLAECRRAGCRYVIIEVTSEGIAQFRHRFIRFAGAVFTNLRPEHLESHGGFERYRAAKTDIFARLPQTAIAVLNRDDEASLYIAARTRARKVWYSPHGIEGPEFKHRIAIGEIGTERCSLSVDGAGVAVRLGGRFNALNVIAAVAAARAFGVPLAAILKTLQTVHPVPGRLEFIRREPFAVIVDYAHTPDALQAVYETLGKNLICVFGAAGGGRDKWKRPELGKIAARHCREIVLTSEDPDDEDPAAIAREIRQGIPSTKLAIARIVLDRREAVRTALAAARPGDTVVITGMGAQPWLVVDGKKIPWDDREIVREELTLPGR